AEIFPAGLIFTGVTGANPGSQDVQIANPSAAAISFISGMIGTGLDYLPKNAVISADQPTTVHVYPDFANLAPGTVQKGTITLQFSDTSPSQTINVLTVVAPAGATAMAARPQGSFAPAIDGCTPQGLYVLFRAPQPTQNSISVRAGDTISLEVQVAD